MNSMRNTTALLACFLFLVSAHAGAQSNSYKQQYLTAKNLLTSGKYNLSMEAFKQLTTEASDNPMVPYANYFYAVSAYKNGYIPLAKDIFLQIEQKYRDWSGLDEVYLWQSKIGFEQSGLFQGMRYLTMIKDDSKLTEAGHRQKVEYLALADKNSLMALLEEYPDDADVGFALANSIDSEPFELKNLSLLDSLIVKFNLDKSAFETQIHEDEFKESYTIGVMLPLFVERLSASGRYLNKSLAVDLYEGISMAMEDLDNSKINIKVYDTKRNLSTTTDILNQPEAATLDAIIGPLFPQPGKIANAFAYDHSINIINPASGNSAIIEHNPYSFLMRTGAKTLGTGVAEYVSEHIENKNVVIYYGTSTTDSIVAHSYKQRMEADSFKVVVIKKVSKENPRAIFDYLTAANQVVDSVALRKLWRTQKGPVRKLPMMDNLFIQPDSIGHIFVASDNSVMASEVMSAVTSRGDSTQIVGVGSWYDGANAGLDLLQSMGVWLAISNSDNLNSATNKLLMERYMDKYHTKPSKYFYMGYHTLQFVSQSLLIYGVYFQNGYDKIGNFNPEWDFHEARDNQLIQIIKLEGGKIVQLNDPND